MEEENANIDLKIPKGVFKFLHQIATRIEVAEGGTYLYMPYWMEILNKKEYLVRFHDLDHIPDELEKAINKLRQVDETAININTAEEEDNVITDVDFEDDENTRESSTDTAGEPSGEK